MTFEDFVTAGKVRKGQADPLLAQSLLKMSHNHMETVCQLAVTPVTAATVMSTSYEALREVVEAMAAKDGYKVYSHEAFTFYLKEKGEERIALAFDRFRKLRNRIHYYGAQPDTAAVLAHRQETERLIRELRQKYFPPD